MSGICAIWRKQNSGKTAESLALVSAALSLDRSEQIKTATDDCAGVGISGRFAEQQIYESPRLLVACDADLYNEAEIAKLLGAAPGFRPGTTAAALAGLYERFGAKLVKKLRGGFSLLVWDKREKAVFAAIDRLGIQRLVYYEDAKVLLVASRIDALLASGNVPRDLNPQAIANYLNYTVNLAPGTILAKVKRLPAGHFLLATDSGVRCQQYWDMQYGQDGQGGAAGLAEQLEAAVQESVQACCKDDPFSTLGAFLSGGTDSSTVTGMMWRLGRGPVKTFSIGFEEQRFNELEYARITARHFQTEHHEYLVTAHDCLEAIPSMVRSFDEPFGNSSAIPTYFCAKLAGSEGVRILLAGDGGDELFGGNERYRTDKIFGIYQQVPRFLRKGLIEPALCSIPFRDGLLGKARSYVRRSNRTSPERFFSYNLLLSEPLEEILEPAALESLGTYSILEIPSDYYWNGPAQAHLDRLLYVDVKITLGDSDLPKVTCMSERAGVRARFPFLDHTIAEFSGCIPAGLKVKGFEKRYLFKRAFRNLLPPEVIRKKKHGFGIPVAVWMKTDKGMRELARDVLLSSRSWQRGYVRRSFIEDLFRRHAADETTYYGDILWTFLVLELWFREFVDGARKVAA